MQVNCDCNHLKNIQIIIFIKRTFNLREWMQMMIWPQEDRKQGSPIIPFHYGHPLLATNKKGDQDLKFLNLGSNIKDSILWALLSSYFVKKEMKEPMTPQTSFFMFLVRLLNLISKLESSSIKTSKIGWWFISFFNLRLMDMARFKASLNKY